MLLLNGCSHWWFAFCTYKNKNSVNNKWTWINCFWKKKLTYCDLSSWLLHSCASCFIPRVVNFWFWFGVQTAKEDFVGTVSVSRLFDFDAFTANEFYFSTISIYFWYISLSFSTKNEEITFLVFRTLWFRQFLLFLCICIFEFKQTIFIDPFIPPENITTQKK